MRGLSLLVAAVLAAAAGTGNSIRFNDTAAEAGIAARIVCGGPEKKWIAEANGTGCAALDYDNDGLLDLLIVNGSTIERLASIVSGGTPSPSTSGVYLYRNLGNGKFEDVTVRAGLFNPYWGTGANAADYNNDGHIDILVTTIGVDLLFRNNGNGAFAEVGKEAGLAREVRWHTGSAFGDYDGDGNLDLYIAGYVDPHAFDWKAAPPTCNYRGMPSFCGPLDLKGEPDILYRNNGDGTFTNVTRQAGVVDAEGRFGFSAVFDDIDQDGKLDIFVANDSGANYLYLNQGNGKFEEAALVSGVAFNADGRSQANMGVAVGDYNNDGRLDLLTTTFSEDYFPLFAQQAPRLFEEISARAGLGVATIPYLGWACGFTDFDNDGDRDLWLANGHVYPTAHKLGTTTYHQPFVVFENHGGRFVKVADAAPGAAKNSYRGGCTADFDNDGRIDVVVLPIDGAPLLLSNATANRHSWIGFSLQGTAMNRDAIGAKVHIEHCGRRQFESVRNGGSYLSRNDPRVHFGLGTCTKVDRVTITWPDGRTQTLRNPHVNQYLTVREP